MWPIKVEYTLSMKMYRMALYYSLVQRYRLAFLSSVPAVILGLLFLLLHLMGVFSFPIAFYIGGACLIWLLMVAARVERNIRTYLKNPDCLFGKRFKVQFTAGLFKLAVEHTRINVSIPLQDLAAAFELTSFYMLYVDGQQTYLVSKEGMRSEEKELLRNRLRFLLEDRFVSRFK